MDDRKLKQHLFSETAHLFAALDGVMVPDLPNRLFDGNVPNECLWTGDLTPDLVYTAPYLVALSPDSKFTDWVFAEALGKHWGIFIRSRHSMLETRNHFRKLISVYDERGNPMRFRFYDPRVLRKFLPTCNPGELKTLFGKASAIFTEADDAEHLLRFEVGPDKLVVTELD